MTPTATPFAERDPEALRLVDELPSLRGNVDGYRRQMREIGRHLADGILSSMPASPQSDLCVVCTVEDADFLAKGVIDALETAGFGERVRLVCLWNERIRSESISISPIIKQYREDFEKDGTTFLVVKSIISGGCVVKTNLTRMLSSGTPGRIYVASPVMLDGVEEHLRDEFPKYIGDRFQFVHFSTHFEKDGENVVPGIGGSVYELLGLGDEASKNSYLPDIVRERRRKAFPTPA
jgi:hypothetical protein